MKTIFKIEDKVYHVLYGWGCITEITDYSMTVDFNGEQVFGFSDDKLFSFTEYTLQGFSQERPINLPEVGELCLVRDNNGEYWRVVQFKLLDKTKPLQFIDMDNDGWKQLKRIKILD
jgi:hypothetical protein